MNKKTWILSACMPKSRTPFLGFSIQSFLSITSSTRAYLTEPLIKVYYLPSLKSSLKDRKLLLLPNSIGLPWHIAAASLELILYYYWGQCSLLAVLACLIHSWTSLMLVKRLQKGYPPLTRMSFKSLIGNPHLTQWALFAGSIYQAGAIARPVLSIYAFCTQKAGAYHDSVVPIHSFVYARALIFFFGTMGPTGNFIADVNSKHVYSISITGSALLAVSHSFNPWAVMEICILTNLIGKIQLWSRRCYDYYRYGILFVKCVALKIG